jgi:CRP/FNR family cyclic AMP-dependent transcriptional regulator
MTSSPSGASWVILTLPDRVSRTEVTGYDIKAEDFVRFVEDNSLWPVMYRAVVRRRRESDQRTVTARLDVRYLLARWLLDLASEVGSETDEGWVIGSLTQKDLAGRIGASRDAVAKELGKLRDQNVVATGRRMIILRDIAALRKIATA